MAKKTKSISEVEGTQNMVPSEASVLDQQSNDMLEGFDIESFYVSNQKTIPIQQEQTVIPVRKPGRQQWIRVHPSLEKDVYLLEWKEENEYYLLQPNILPHIMTKVRQYRLYLGMFHGGGLFFFPVVLADELGKWNSWHLSAFKAIPKAKEKWIRFEADKQTGVYQIFEADGLADPVWPELTINKALLLAFKERVITSKDHPIIKQLTGKFNEKIE